MEMIWVKLFLLLGSHLCFFTSYAVKIGETKVVYEWIKLEFLWPNQTIKESYMKTGKFIPENCILSALEVFNKHVFVTVPRLRNGVPSSLNVLEVQPNKTLLKPYPSLEKNIEGADKCDNFQFVSNIAIDGRNGWMWIIDTGRVNLLPFDGTSPINMCPAKIVIYDTQNNKQVRGHFFSEKVVSKTSNYLSDIVIDGKMAYISDTFDNKLIVYNYDTDTSFSIKDSTMMPDPTMTIFKVGGTELDWKRGINSIAISTDFKTLYYSPLSSLNLYSVPTSVINQNITAFKSSVKYMGNLTSVTDAMICSPNHLYVSLISKDAIYYWDINKGSNLASGEKNEKMETLKMLTQNSKLMQWPDSMTIDGHYLWFITNRKQKFFTLMDFTGGDGVNFRILKTYIHGDAVKNTFCLITLLISLCVTVFVRLHWDQQLNLRRIF